MSGVPFWQDDSGVLGVTIISSSISTSTPVTSGSVQVSGAVRVSGTVEVSGNVFALGQSGIAYAQATSGTLLATASGLVHGAIIAHIGLCEPAAGATFASGQPTLIRLDNTGKVVTATQVSGSVIVSGIVGISGSVGILSGLVAILSGEIHLISGDISVSGTVTFLNTGIRVSGAVQVSGRVFALGQSGVAIWTDDSGVVGVTIISSNISTTTPITSGSVQVSGTVAVSGGVIVSGTVNVVGVPVTSGSVQVSGTVSVSGEVTVSGTVFIVGNSGVVVAQVVSGTLADNYASGQVHGGLVAHIGVVEPVNTIHKSGQPTLLKTDANGKVITATQVSGAVQISGLVGVLSGVISSSGDLYTITNTSMQVSGTVSVSGRVFALGQSGIAIWTDDSGVVGVTILSGVISVAVPITSGSVQVSGTVAVSGGVIVSGTVNVPGTRVSGTVAVSGIVFVQGMSGITFWQDDSGVIGVTILSANITTSTPITSGSVIVSGTVGINSGLVGVLSGSIGARVSGAVIVSGTVGVSGVVFIQGMSGVTFWQDDSGVLGVTILSAVITVSTPVTSGSVQVSGTVAVSGGVIVSGTVNVVGVPVTSGSIIVSGTVAVSGEVFAVGMSGLRFPQVTSGTLIDTTSGLVHGGLIGHVGIVTPVAINMASGQPNLLACDAGGRLLVTVNNVTATSIRSGLVAVLSGDIHVTSGALTIISGGVFVSGTVTFLNTAIQVSGAVQVSGTVAVSGGVIVSGTVVITGQSGALVPQTLSGWAHSGVNFGQLGVAAIVESTTPIRVSGLLGALSTDMSGNLRVVAYNITSQISGVVRVSGTVEVSGQIGVLSGLIAILSGNVGAQVSGGVIVSGTVAVSGKVFAAGMSGINYWQDASGVVGVTIISSNISVAGWIISGSVIVSGTVAVSGLVGIQSGLIAILSGSITVNSGVAYIAGSSGFLTHQTLSGWAHSGVRFGDLAVAPAIVEAVTPVRTSGVDAQLSVDMSGNLRVVSYNATSQISGTIEISGRVAVLSGLVALLSGEVHILSGSVVIISGGVFVSGTVSVLSGAFVTSKGTGMSGIAVWQDASGVQGVTIISSNISVTATATLSTPTQGRSRGTLMVTSNSGGDQLASGDCITVTIKMLNEIHKSGSTVVSQSGVMLIGFDAAGERPYAFSSGMYPSPTNSGYGFILTAGEAITYNIDNMNRIRVYSMLSGEMISYTANQT